MKSYKIGADLSNLSLAERAPGAENGGVRDKARYTVCSVTLLFVCLAAMPQGQDRDTRGIPKTSEAAPPVGERVDINHASLEELLKVPGLSRTWAARIVRFRPYRTKQDLLEYGIVSDSVYDRIKDYVVAHHKAQSQAGSLPD